MPAEIPQDERLARAHFRLYTSIMERIDHISSTKTRNLVETILFIVVLHVVAIVALLHISFISASAASNASCLEPFLPPQVAARAPTDWHLLRFQVVPTCSTESSTTHFSCGSESSSSKEPLASFVYASQRGFLALIDEPSMLRQPLNQTHNNELLVVKVPRASPCFDLQWIGHDSPLWDFLLDSLLGYDTILLNHIAKWRSNDGVLLNEDSHRIHALGYGSFPPLITEPTYLEQLLAKVHTLYLCVSLFFVCAALVSFLIHEANTRMLLFSDLVDQRVAIEDRAQYTRALGTHCAQSLMLIPVVLGMTFFLVELYKDHVLAFGMLAVVALGEGFAVICARTKLSRLFYPPLFFCWFALFHIYIVAFPFGFTHAALVALALTLLHTIVFFTNCLEWPAFVSQEDGGDVPQDRG